MIIRRITHFTLCIFFSAFAGGVFSQNDTLLQAKVFTIDQLQAQQDSALSPHSRVYARARALRDWNTAITAIHYLILEQPGNTYLEDTLAALYARLGNYHSCRTWCEEVLKSRPKAGYEHLLLAQINEQEGNLNDALMHYEFILNDNRSSYIQYQVAALQFQLERLGECRANAETLIENSSDELIRIQSNHGADDVPLYAAAWNLLGVLERKLGNEKEAKTAFRKAIEIAPGFKLAKENLDSH